MVRPLVILFLLAGLLAAQKPAEKKSLYDKNANAQEIVEAARAKAARDHKRVLVMIGGDWCGWCHRLHDTFKKNRKVARQLSYEYELVLVDSKAKGLKELVAKWESPVKSYPYLVVLDEKGACVRNQHTEPLEKDKGHDPEKVLAFLVEHQAPRLDARKVLADAKAEAAASKRHVFVHLGAPWCGWCHRLEDFLARPKIAAIVAKDFIDLKIDQDRMLHGKEVSLALRKTDRGGIPWSLLLSPAGEQVITSDAKGPGKGNIGFPVDDPEIEHFMVMLEKGRKNASKEEHAFIRQALLDNAAAIKAARRKRSR